MKKTESFPIQILSHSLLILLLYFLGNGLWQIFDGYIRPAIDPNRPGTPISFWWPYATITLLNMVVQAGLAGKARFLVRAGLSRGWWLAGTLFTFLAIGSLIGILQLTLMKVGPQQQPLYQLNPWGFARAVVLFLFAISLLVFITNNNLMTMLGITINRKMKTIGRLLLYGLGLYLLMMMLAIAISSINVLILE